MLWGMLNSERADLGKWHEWFAWYPVHLEDGRWLWLQKVKRNITCGFCLDEFYTICKYEVVE